MLKDLIEKKDLIVYLNLRRIELRENMKEIPSKEIPKKRQTAIKQIKGRIEELTSLISITNSNKFNEKGKSLWKELYKKGLVELDKPIR